MSTQAVLSAMATKKRAPGSSERAVMKRIRFSSNTVTHAVNTRFARVQAVCNAVLHTNELLLQILHELNTASLLAMHSTNKTIRNLIDITWTLRIRLFVSAIDTPESTQWLMDMNNKRIRKYIPDEEEGREYEWRVRQWIITLATVNPLLFKRQKSQICNLETRFQVCETLRFTLRPSLDIPARDANYMFVNKVHNMYLCQPPVTWAEVYYSYTRESGRFKYVEHKRIVIENSKGVRFGHVVEAFAQTLRPVKQGVCRLRLARCAVWLKGVVLASAEEIRVVEGNARGVVLVGKKLVPLTKGGE